MQKHSSVNQVAVFGVPHSDWGEAVMAMVVLKPKQNVNEEEIIEYCKRNLSKYKCPKEIRFIDSLPTTPYGKIDKKVLRKPYWENSGRKF
nr:hypothetical protein [Oceanobacillus piezotolerans]